MSLCLVILQKHLTSFNIQNPGYLNMPGITGPFQPMAPNSNFLRPNQTYWPYKHLGHNDSNPLRAPFCNIPDQLILPCYLP